MPDDHTVMPAVRELPIFFQRQVQLLFHSLNAFLLLALCHYSYYYFPRRHAAAACLVDATCDLNIWILCLFRLVGRDAISLLFCFI